MEKIRVYPNDIIGLDMFNKINELVDVWNQAIEEIRTIKETVNELTENKPVFSAAFAKDEKDSVTQVWTWRLQADKEEIGRLTKENEELKAKLLKVSEYAKQKRVALNCNLTCIMSPEEILYMIGEKV